MKSIRNRLLLPGAALLLGALLPFAAGAFASEAGAAAPTPEAPLRELGTPSAGTQPERAPGSPDAASADHPTHRQSDDRVSVLGSVVVDSDERVRGDAVAVLGGVRVDGSVTGDAVAVLGSNTVNGTVRGDSVAVLGSLMLGPDETVGGSAVAVLGSNTVGGTVGKDAVAVLGSTTVNGTVHGNAVAVFGNLTLGPGARVDGDVVSQFGHVICDPTASYGGSRVEQASIEGKHFHRWLQEGPGKGRPLIVALASPFFWIANGAAFALYLLFALAFPNAVSRCANTLAERPGITFLTGILAILALPLLAVLLFITLVGIPVAVIVLPIAVIGSVLFGKSAVYTLTGRRIIGSGHPVVFATLVGLALFFVLYLVPVLGFLAWFTVAFLGFACVVATLFSGRRAGPSAPPPAQAQAPSAVAAAAVPPPAAVEMAVAAPAVMVLPPVIEAAPLVPAAAPAPVQSPAATPESTLPRAGFWIRMAALAIDVVLVAIVTRAHDWFLPALAAYAAVLWKFRGATLGGIIFGIKVVRVDGRPSDWVTMIVRALACFISLVIVGLGFLWIAFDPEKQAWHDKIAGTVVVQLPKGASLV